MVTTRSKTDSLPLPAGSRRNGNNARQNTTRPGQVVAHAATPQIGDNDKFSVLPFEILTIIFEICQPVELLSLCRLNKVFRILLTDARAEAIWIHARKSMSVKQQRQQQIRDLPAPPPFLTEIGWADFLFGEVCQYCSDSYSCYRHEGMYKRACRKCTIANTTNIHKLKEAYEKDEVDIRLYSVIPFNRVGRSDASMRQFWKPTADAMKLEMAEYEVEVGFDEAAISQWVTRRRHILSQDKEGKNLRQQVSLWEAAFSSNVESDSSRRLRRRRNKAVLKHCLRDSGHDPADLDELFRMKDPNRVHLAVGLDLLLSSRTWILPTDQVSSILADNATLLQEIRKFRLDHENYQKSLPMMDDVKDRISSQLQAGEDIVWDIDYASLMVDVMQTEAVQAYVEAARDPKTDEDKAVVWSQNWQSIHSDVQALEDEWAEKLLVLIFGVKACEKNTKDTLKALTTFFKCENCKEDELPYPAVYQHACFSKMSDSPRYTARNTRPMPTGRLKALDLNYIRYDRVRSESIASMFKAIGRAGVVAPSSVQALEGLDGIYRCLVCPESDRRRLGYWSALEHASEYTTSRKLEEDGEYSYTSKLHNKLEFTLTSDDVWSDESDW